MKITIPTLLLLIIPCLMIAQDVYDNGLIITKELDTIYCFVPLKINYGKTIKIISYEDSTTTKKINSRDIKFLATRYNVYENVTYKQKKKEIEQLMRFVVEGFLNLYLNTYQNKTPSYSGDGGTYTMYSSPTLEYVIKRDDQTYFVKRSNFREVIISIMSDVPEIVDKIENKTYKFENIEEIVIEYNKFHSN